MEGGGKRTKFIFYLLSRNGDIFKGNVKNLTYKFIGNEGGD